MTFSSPLGAVSYSRGAVLSLYEDRDGGNCHASGGGMPIPHPESDGSSKDHSVAKQRAGVPHSTLKSDEEVVDHKGSSKVFIERISDARDTIEPSSDCLVNEEKDNCADSKYLKLISEEHSSRVVFLNRSHSFPSGNGRTPSDDTSLRNG